MAGKRTPEPHQPVRTPGSGSPTRPFHRRLLDGALEIPSAIGRQELVLAGVVFAISFLVYVLTLAPTVTAEDSGELIAASYLGGVAHPPGFPLWCILTRPFLWVPIGDVAWRANLASAFFGSVTAAGAFLLALRWGASRVCGMTAALALAFSQRFWSQCVITEVYALNTALLVAILLCVETFRRPLWEVDGAVDQHATDARKRNALLLLGFVSGLSLTNHYMLMMLAPPGIAAALVPEWRWLRKEWRWLLGAAGLGVAGLLVYLRLPIAASRNTFMNWGDPSTWSAFWDHVLRRSYRSLEFSEEVTSGTKLLFFGHAAYELWNQFTPYLLLLAPVGLAALWRKDRSRFAGSVLVFLLNTVVLLMILRFSFERENRQRVEVYYLPAYTMAAIWIGLGATRALERVRAWAEASAADAKGRLAGTTRGVTLTAATAFAALAPLLPFLRHVDENNRGGFWIARDYAESILRTARKDAVIFPSADYTTFPLIYLMGVEEKRPDILLGDKYGGLCPETHDLFRKVAPEVRRATRDEILLTIAERSGRPVYVTNRSVVGPGMGKRLAPEGLLYRVLPGGERHRLPAGIWNDVTIRNLTESASSRDPMERGLASSYYRMRAESCFAAGRADYGTAFLRKAADAVSDDHTGLNNLASVAGEHGQNGMAVEFYRRALDVWPFYATPHVNLARTAISGGRLEDAEAHIQDAAAIDPADHRLEGLRQDLAGGALEARIRNIQAELKLRPKDATLQNDLGTALAHAGRAKEAAEHWLTAVELKPSYALPHKNLSVYYEKEARDPERARHHMQEYERLLKTDPE
ncbi:MAG: protein O-mannosyl-transferase family [Planctomycetota bacterium]|jgi:Flp pilus assembly protein TadD